MSPTPPVPPKLPSCADCVTTTQFAGGAPQQSPSRMIAASDGKMRIDMPNMSIITDPKAQQAMVLNHVTKEASILSMTPTPPQIQGMPQAGGTAPPMKPPAMPAMSVQDLGKGLIEGHEVDGKRYVVQPPQVPQAPQAPGIPQAPQIPQMPKPAVPTVADVWTSSKLGVPVLTTVTGPFGQQTSYCRPAQTGEPHPALFQIPPGYKPVMPK